MTDNKAEKSVDKIVGNRILYQKTPHTFFPFQKILEQ